MATYAGSYSGRPAYSLRVDLSLYEQDLVANQSRFATRLYIRHDTSASNNTWASTARSWALATTGWATAGSAPFMMGPSGDFVGKEITLYSGVTGWVSHDAMGALTLAVSAYHTMSPDVMGNASLSGSFAVPTIPRNLARVGVAGVWTSSAISVGVNGAWVPAQPYVGVDDEWKLLNNA